MHVQAGYNSGYSDAFYEMPTAMTAQVLLLSNTSNVDVTGRWAFRIGEIENTLGCYTDGRSIVFN
jgi:Nidogen-like